MEDINRLKWLWRGAHPHVCSPEMGVFRHVILHGGDAAGDAATVCCHHRRLSTLPSLEADTCRYEEEVNGYLKEMGFIL